MNDLAKFYNVPVSKIKSCVGKIARKNNLSQKETLNIIKEGVIGFMNIPKGPKEMILMELSPKDLFAMCATNKKLCNEAFYKKYLKFKYTPGEFDLQWKHIEQFQNESGYSWKKMIHVVFDDHNRTMTVKEMNDNISRIEKALHKLGFKTTEPIEIHKFPGRTSVVLEMKGPKNVKKIMDKLPILDPRFMMDSMKYFPNDGIFYLNVMCNYCA